MFKSRSSSSSQPAPVAIEVIRQRAKHRLIGASVLVLAGVVVFPLLFDTQPRPIPVDIAVDIPSRQAVKPLAPTEPAASAKNTAAPVPATAEASTAPKATGKELPLEEIIQPAKSGVANGPDAESPVAAVSKPKPTASDGKPVTPVADKPAVPPHQKATDAAAKTKDAERAQALLDGKAASAGHTAAPPAPVPGERFIVQLGAFAESARAQEVRLKLERAGLKTYTHVAETSEGKRIRVRLGPFASRAEADKAAAKAKAVGVPAAILTL